MTTCWQLPEKLSIKAAKKIIRATDDESVQDMAVFAGIFIEGMTERT